MLEKNAIQLAEQLIKQHGLSCSLDIRNVYSWNGAYNGSKNTIYLSLPFLQNNEEKDVKNVLLHEIAHAIVGTKHKHDEVWKQKCIEIGGDGKVANSYNYNIPYKYKLICTHCGRVYPYLRKPTKRTIKFGRCNKCHSTLKLEVL